jgi:hypothetical protein
MRVYADNKHFPKNSSFFHNFIYLLNQANDVYVKIYATAQVTMFYVFKSKNKYSP